jgi:hypothetical protein
MLKALCEGLPSVGIREETLLFGVSPSGFRWGFGTSQSYSTSGFRNRRHSGLWSDRNDSKTIGQKIVLLGDTFVVKAESLDDSLWKCGGAAVGLRLVDLAEVEDFFHLHESLLNLSVSFRLPMSFLELLAFLQMASRIVGKTQKTWKGCVGSLPLLEISNHIFVYQCRRV